MRIIRPAFALATALFALVILISAVHLLGLYRNQPLGVDFAPVWVAATIPHDAYDVQAITSIQSDVFARDLAARPFAYPPTTLLLVLPFGFLGLWCAYGAFVALSSALFVLGLRHSEVSLSVFLFPPIVILLHVGQVSLMAGSLLLLALASSNWKWRGFLFPMAVALKPQLAIFLPALLLLQQDWRSLGLTVFILGLIVAGSIGFFGFGLWQEWGQSLRDLVQIVNSNPSLAAHQIEGSLLFLPISLVTVWVGRKSDAATQLGLVVGAALLISPYAMNYELALLLPAIAKKGFQTDKSAAAVALILAVGFVRYPSSVLLITLGYLIWRSWPRVSTDANETDLVRMNAMPTQ